MKKNQKIIFKNIDMQGKDQEKWFKIFDLFDEIFGRDPNIEFNGGTIMDFFFDAKELPKGTMKREFAEIALKLQKKK